MVLFEDPRTVLSMHVSLEERAWEFDKTGDALYWQAPCNHRYFQSHLLTLDCLKPLLEGETPQKGHWILGIPVVPFFPFCLEISLSKLNLRKKGILIFKGLLGNLNPKP